MKSFVLVCLFVFTAALALANPGKSVIEIEQIVSQHPLILRQTQWSELVMPLLMIEEINNGSFEAQLTPELEAGITSPSPVNSSETL